MREEVVLVDRDDQEIGVEEKQKAHELGLLHRAFSVFLFDGDGRFLLQRRALNKYHSAGLWTNTCCSHPRPEEETLIAARRRLVEEMGIDVELEHQFSFYYKVKFDNNLWEHELDHVFFGNFNGDPICNSEEVASFKWIRKEKLEEDILAQPDNYSYWFRSLLKEIKNYRNKV